MAALASAFRKRFSANDDTGKETLTTLAERVRAAATQNDPDVQRAELADIAEALEALGSHMTQSVRLPKSEAVAE